MSQDKSHQTPAITSSTCFTRIVADDKDVAVLDNGCLICLEAIKVGEEVIKMSCHHFYHSTCIGNWLRQKSSCPQCRHFVNDNPFLEIPAERSDNETQYESDLELGVVSVELILRGLPTEDMIDGIEDYDLYIRRLIVYDSETEDES